MTIFQYFAFVAMLVVAAFGCFLLGVLCGGASTQFRAKSIYRLSLRTAAELVAILCVVLAMSHHALTAWNDGYREGWRRGCDYQISIHMNAEQHERKHSDLIENWHMRIHLIEAKFDQIYSELKEHDELFKRIN